MVKVTIRPAEKDDMSHVIRMIKVSQPHAPFGKLHLKFDRDSPNSNVCPTKSQLPNPN